MFVIEAVGGALAQAVTYDSFGAIHSDTNPGFTPFGFAGGLYDPATGFVRFGERDYAAETGRWTAKDSTLFGGGDPNLYDYAFTDPVNFQDPTGRIAIVDDATVAATIETLVAIGLTYELAKAIYEQYQAENRLDDLLQWLESRRVGKGCDIRRTPPPGQKYQSKPPDPPKPAPPADPKQPPVPTGLSHDEAANRSLWVKAMHWLANALGTSPGP